MKEEKRLVNIYVGKKIWEFRKKKGYNQGQLGTAIGLTRTSMTNIEAGVQTLSVELLLKICAVLEVKPADILPKIPKVTVKASTKIRRVIEEKTLSASFKFQI